MSDLLRAQLQVLRSQLDAMHATVDSIVVSLNGQSAAQPGLPMGACPNCGGPEEKQVDASTLTSPGLKKCMLCQAEYQGV